MSQKIKIRLYFQQNLSTLSQIVPSEEQLHYLNNVLRIEDGEIIAGFDGQSGEFALRVCKTGKKNLSLLRLDKLRNFYLPPDLWLLFAPIKKDKTDFIIEKACELGVRKIVPTITKHTISDKVRLERYQAQAIEACEQCRRLEVPEISAPIQMDELLKNWPAERKLFYMDETGKGENVISAFHKGYAPAAILVGPEGGFAPDELEKLAQQDFARGVSLGRRILRAETAVAAALSCWQAICGDWNTKGE